MSGEMAWAAVVAVFFVGCFLTIPGCAEKDRQAKLKCIELTHRPVECRFAIGGG